LGIAFQVQDDYLDAFGDLEIRKKIRGDILANKKTFLLIHANGDCQWGPEKELERLLTSNDERRLRGSAGIHDCK